MPTTLVYRPLLIDGLVTNDRINSYKAVFKPSNDVELMGAYLWNAHVCGALYPIIGAAEIALRNAIDQALRARNGTFWWSGSKLKFKSFTPHLAPTAFPKPVKNVRDNFSKAADKFINEKKARYHITGSVPANHHGVIAKTEFSTWQFLLDAEFMGPNLFWPRDLGTVFRGPWPSTHASTTLNHAHDLVSTIRDFRNRLFHHEPAWKRYGVATENDAISHLHEKLDKIVTLLALIHPENVRLFEKNSLLNSARRACSSSEIRRFQHTAKSLKIKSIGKLGVAIESCAMKNQVLKVQVYRGKTQKFLMVPV